jgi:serine protease AprX
MILANYARDLLSNPLSVTLVWRDPPGNTIQNSIHLRLIHDGSGTTFTSEAIENIRNNVQKVVVNTPKIGIYHIEVEDIIITEGVPELLPAVRQDYALVVSNATGLSLVS